MEAHGINCNCYECVDGIIGMFLRSDIPITIFNKDGKVFRTAKPNSFIGKVKTVKDDDLVLAGDYYVKQSKDLIFVKPDPNFKELTDKQKLEIVLGTMDALPNGKLITTVYEVGEGVADTVNSGLNFVGFIGRNMKWILISIVLLIVISYSVKVYNIVK